jgi:predicted metal-dependent HD superfamily phosphohydrolase
MQLIPALKEQWLNLTAQYSTDEPLLLQEFDHLITHYSTINRFYHNLQHIHNLLLLQQQYAEEIKDHDTIGFAIFYHDLVYDVMKNDNEEESALAAGRFLQQTNVPVTQAEKVMAYIRATKSHDGNSPDNDLLLFLDFDMAILGSSAGEYQQYVQQIRLEYNSYNDTAYNMGRSKVLQHFLQMPHIYSTETFRNKYEQQARENINAELAALKVT